MIFRKLYKDIILSNSMHFIIFFIHALITPFLIACKIKACINCKYIMRTPNLFHSKCFLFPKITKESEFEKRQHTINKMVSGEDIRAFDNFFYCSTAREFDYMCGLNGTKFVTNE